MADVPARRLGIDVGGTKCLGVVLGPDGEVVDESRRPTPMGPELVDVLVEVAETLAPFDTIGVGLPGLVSREGVFRASPHIRGVADLAVATLLSERLGRPVAVDSDATCAVLAEWKLGAARGYEHVVLVTLGTGIGGGLVAEGTLVRGANGFTGEYGHMVVDPDGPECPCGRRGCWERFASGGALTELARQEAADGRLDAVLELAGGDVEAITGLHVREAAAAGDPGALAVFDQTGRWLGIGLVNLTNALDPEIFVLGGGVVEAGDLLLSPSKAWLTRLLYAPERRPHPALALASTGERAGAIGAALLPAERL